MDKSFAFPFPEVRWPDGTGVLDGACGMTKREYYAAAAMQGMMAGLCAGPARDVHDENRPRAFNRVGFSDVAQDAFMMADAMLAFVRKDEESADA